MVYILINFTMTMYLSFNGLYHKYDPTDRLSAKILMVEARLMANTEKNRNFRG